MTDTDIGAERRSAVAPMKHTGDSANIAFYREKGRDDPLWCEVLCSHPYIKGVGFDNKAIPTFYFRVYRGTIAAGLVAKFDYTPKSKPREPLSPVTVTRLVREALVP